MELSRKIYIIVLQMDKNKGRQEILLYVELNSGEFTDLHTPFSALSTLKRWTMVTP